MARLKHWHESDDKSVFSYIDNSIFNLQQELLFCDQESEKYRQISFLLEQLHLLKSQSLVEIIHRNYGILTR